MSTVVGQNSLVSINRLIDYAGYKLSRTNISNPKLEGELLLSHLLGLSRFDLYFKKIEVNEELIHSFEQALELRAKRYPLQYITGRANFIGLDFSVSPAVLIPRPETEILVERAINILNSSHSAEEACVLDIGTGAGNIAISLTKRISKCRIWATDICPQALAVAKRNARSLEAEDKITFILADIWPGAGKEKQKFDLIVSNPPYIARDQLAALPGETRFEPTLALAGGEKGLDFFKRIIRQSINYLNRGGYLLLEVGDNQIQAVKEIIAAVKSLSEVQIFKDLNNRPRVILTRKK